MNFYFHSLSQEGKLLPNSCDWLINTLAIDVFLLLSFGCPDSTEEGSVKGTHPFRCSQSAPKSSQSWAFPFSSGHPKPVLGQVIRIRLLLKSLLLTPVSRFVVLRAHSYFLEDPEKEFSLRGSSYSGCSLLPDNSSSTPRGTHENVPAPHLKLCHISRGNPRFP